MNSQQDTEGEERPTPQEALNERRAELNNGLREAYAAGLAKAVEQFDIDADFDTDVRSLKDNEFVAESHFYYWEGRTRPLEYWLPVQFGVEEYPHTPRELEPVQAVQDANLSPLDEAGEGLVAALESAGAHQDIIEYVHICRENYELTGLIETMHTFHRGGEGEISKLSEIGNKKEKILWEKGAEAALEKVGNWDTTNKPILQEIAGGAVADA